MTNLIITIVGITLLAVAAIMGVYYGGIAYQNAQINAIATATINEAQQILAAERMWAVKNSQPDISPLANPSELYGGVWQVGTYDRPMFTFIVDGELSSWPSLAGNIAPPATGYPSDDSCYSIQGYQGEVVRQLDAYQGSNYVSYSFNINNVPYNGGNCLNFMVGNASFSASTTDTSQANHPIVKIAQAINNSLNQIPADADLSRMPYVGLPITAANSPVGYSVVGSGISMSAAGVLQTNYCYISAMNSTNWGGVINCVFGPS